MWFFQKLVDICQSNRGRIGAVLLILALLFGIGLHLRLTRVALVAGDADTDPYMILAKEIRANRVMACRQGTYAETDHLRKPPVLPYFLSLFSTHDQRLFSQALISTSLIFFIFILGYLWSGSAAGLLAAAIWTFWGPAVFLSNVIRPEPLFLFFFMAGLILTDYTWARQRYLWAFPAGIFLAVSELTRPVLLPFFCLCLLAQIYFVFLFKKKRLAHALLLAAFLCGLALPVAGYHIKAKSNGFTWVYDRKGVTLLTAALDDGEVHNYLKTRKPAHWEAMNDAQRDHFVIDLFSKKVLAEPEKYIYQAKTRIWNFWTIGFGDWETRLFTPGATFSFFALIGLITLYQKRRRAFVLSFFLFIDFSIMAAVIFQKPRFREVITPWFLVLFALGLVSAFRLLVKWRRKSRYGYSFQNQSYPAGDQNRLERL